VKATGELLEWMRSQKDKATYGHGGPGSASHLCMLMLMRHAGVTMTGVAYRGTGPAMTVSSATLRSVVRRHTCDHWIDRRWKDQRHSDDNLCPRIIPA
jgi:hypothetical protein